MKDTERNLVIAELIMEWSNDEITKFIIERIIEVAEAKAWLGNSKFDLNMPFYDRHNMFSKNHLSIVIAQFGDAEMMKSFVDLGMSLNWKGPVLQLASGMV